MVFDSVHWGLGRDFTHCSIRERYFAASLPPGTIAIPFTSVRAHLRPPEPTNAPLMLTFAVGSTLSQVPCIRPPRLAPQTLPNPPLQNLSYEVKNSANKKETLKLLDDVNGYMEPGELACLM